MSGLNGKILVTGICCFIGSGLALTPGYAHHRHHHTLPPKPVEEKIDPKRPQQTSGDVKGMPDSVRRNIQSGQGANDYQAVKKGDDAPVLLLPNHYTRGDKGHLNANQGWVNSKRQRGHHDIGINAPVPQTADPTQNKTKGVFRRAVPLYEPDY